MSEMVEMTGEFSYDPKIAFQQMVSAAAAGLGEHEYWCIAGEDGIFEATASKDVTRPVVVFCDAVGIEWDQAREQGFYLTRITLPDAALSEEGR